MKKRIYGIETEYGVALIAKNNRWNCDSTVLSQYYDFLRSEFFYEFLPNGSRCYIDVAFHPEYCTAECLNLADLVAQDKAGERILLDIFNRVVEGKEGVKRIALFKNNVQYAPEDDQSTPQAFSSTPVSFGCHENFSMDKRLGLEIIKLALTPFLVARQILCGSGWVTNVHYQRRKSRYAISQRTRFMNKYVGNNTRGWTQRPIICTARWDEPHADSSKYQRMHLILGDSNMSELSTYLKMATLGILLEMIEEGYPFAERCAKLMPLSPVDAIKLVSLDLTCRNPVIELDAGKFISAVDMLLEYAGMMDEYEEVQGLNPDLSEALKRFKDVLRRLGKREMDSETLMETDSQGLGEELDWLIKKTILDRTLMAYGSHWNNFYGRKIDFVNGRIGIHEKLMANDLKYHDISPQGLYNQFIATEPNLPISRLNELGIRTPRLVDKEKIENMEKNPPQNTRAKIRGDLIKLLAARGNFKFRIDWEQIVPIAAGYGDSIALDDPFAAQNDMADLLKSRI